MSLFKIIASCIILFCAGARLSFFQESPPITDDASFQLPTSQLPLEAFVKYVPAPFRSNNKINYLYEINILNNYDLDFGITKIEVFDTRFPSKSIGKFDEEYLKEHLTFPGRDRHELKANGFAVAGLWLKLNESSNLPKEIFHRIYFSHKKANGDISKPTLDAVTIQLPHLTSVTLGLPFRQGKWFYAANHQRNSRMVFEGSARYPHRYAIDWIKVDDLGRYSVGDPSVNANWITYAEEILAVEDGIVVDVKDGIPENEPDALQYAVDITRNTLAGNSIVLDLGNGIRAVYAHLIPLSTSVKIGDKIQKGQVIGLLGNSGDSDCPHLNFHIETDSHTYLGGEGLSFHFEAFTQLDQYSEEELDIIWKSTENQLPTNKLSPSLRENELPLGNGLLSFE